MIQTDYSVRCRPFTILTVVPPKPKSRLMNFICIYFKVQNCTVRGLCCILLIPHSNRGGDFRYAVLIFVIIVGGPRLRWHLAHYVFRPYPIHISKATMISIDLLEPKIDKFYLFTFRHCFPPVWCISSVRIGERPCRDKASVFCAPPETARDMPNLAVKTD